MNHRDILVIGASAGGVEALLTLLAGLPEALPAAILVVTHISPHLPSHLASILGKVACMPVANAGDGMPIESGRIYVAVPDHHLLIEGNRMRITRGPRENRSRPAIDVLFRSAAYHFGPRVIGILLTGNLDDGSAGLWAIKDRGGIALVQSPDEALFPSMPENAVRQVAIDHVLPVAAMPELIASLVREPVADVLQRPPTRSMEIETDIALNENTMEYASVQLGPLSPNTCPECHGSLFQVQEGPILRYRCHVGHAFSQQTLLALVNDEIDRSCGKLLRTVEERTLLLRKMSEQFAADEPRRVRYAQLIAESEQWAQRVRELSSGHGEFGQHLLSVPSP